MNTEAGVPDGGWGWVVVAGTAIINVVNQSLLSMFGLIFGPKLEMMAGTTGVTTVMSLNCTISNFSGFLISPLSKYFSTKQITQIGVLLVSAGLAFSTYTKSYMRITIGYGVLTGLGLGLIASSTFLIINSYFDKNKSQAVGLSMAGTSIGQMGMPPIVALLIQHYGYDGTILILSGLSLHGLIGSLFFDPVSEHMLPRSRQRTKGFFSRFRDWFSCRRNQKKVVIENNFSPERTDPELTNKCANNNIDREANLTKLEAGNKESVISNECTIKNETIADIINKSRKGEDLQTETDKFEFSASDNENNDREEEERMLPPETTASQKEEKISKDEPQTCYQKLVELFDLHILLDPIFVHIMIGLSFAYTTSISFSTFFPLFLREDLDMTIIDVSTCMSVLSFMDFIGRVIVPLITKRMEITHRMIFIIGSFLLAICRSILAIQTTYSMLILLSAICGLARAATVINQNLVIAEYSKEGQISSAVGLNMVCKGIFVLTIGRMLGTYKDSAHNFSSCIHILNIISGGVVVSWTLELLILKLCKKKNAT
ncbi:monocarboxylate transporter 5-like [Tribolium madens]|uniref:monocarboxylate transporter 5-like n=1 Tax=Tribolium madens TaxID=41895 RepID=UPI001CF75AB6|nr:monocarboxylate transporter 5-like [Tribolium madens]XP_044257069.1 monocarboxylate transporter 5-like [Tribolium madens]XP_044257070.1 monocarboxylate transporter 5-like [Tribolium madens]XP_044257071.1 monocarboxylate transporter 5-like [Tribolium madens]XP_044257072.1 monocarboxylate transporter 5-like [Tribolium madens]